ncbi:class I adenylate-forming enzyme family protein [Candidatus Omnitrophota bacterium]
MLIQEALTGSVVRSPDKKAVIYGSQCITYKALDEISDIVAKFLVKSDMEKGDRVAILMDNYIENVVLFFATLKAGCIEVGLSPRMSTKFIIYSLTNCSVKILFVQGVEKEVLEEILRNVNSLDHVILFDESLLDCSTSKRIKISLYSQILATNLENLQSFRLKEEDICMIQYTSGSTGTPKGAMLTHKNFITATKSRTQYLNIDTSEIYFLAVSLAHSCGKSTLIDCVYNRNTVVLSPGNLSPADFLESIINNEVTSIIGPPFIYNFLLKANRISSVRDKLQNQLRHLEIGLSHVPRNLIYELRSEFPGASIAIRYGLTENAGAACLHLFSPESLLEKVDSCGKGMSIVNIRIIGETGDEILNGSQGELVLSGDNVMPGYWGQTDSSLSDPGFHSGDLGRKDQDGFIYITGRKTEMIKCRGERVSPQEVEEILLNSSLVKEAAAISVKDDLFGSKLKVVVVPSSSDITAGEINKFCRLNMPSFMVPELIELRSSLPKAPSGKIDKISLRS